MQRKLLSWMFIFVALIFQCSSASAFDPGSWERAGAITGNVTLSVVSPTLNTIDSTSGSVTVTLPDAASVKGKPFAFKKIAGSNSVILTRAGSDTLEGSVSISFSSSIQNQVVVIESDGTPTWRVLQNSAPPNGGTSGQVEQSNGAGAVKTWTTPSSGGVTTFPSSLLSVSGSTASFATGQTFTQNTILTTNSSGAVGWDAIDLDTSSTIYGRLPLSKGGTGRGSWLTSGIPYYDSGTSTTQLQLLSHPGASDRILATTSGGGYLWYNGIPNALIAGNGSRSDGILTITSSSTLASRSIVTGNSGQILVTNGNGVSGDPAVSLANNVVFSGTEGITMPSGTTAQRPGSGNGVFRYNSSLSKAEFSANGSWFQLGHGITTPPSSSSANRFIRRDPSTNDWVQSSYALPTSIGTTNYYTASNGTDVVFRELNMGDAGAGTLAIARGGTNNGSLSTTNLSVCYTDGSKIVSATPAMSSNAVFAGDCTWKNILTMFATQMSNVVGFPAITTGSGIQSRTLTGTPDQISITNPDGDAGDPTIRFANNLFMPGAAGCQPPAGSTAQRGSTEGQVRYNTDDDKLEYRNATTWVQLGNVTLPSNIAYVDAANNFTASQVPNAVNAIDLGSTTRWFRYLYLSDSGTNYAKIDTTTLTGNRTVNIANADSTTVVPDTGSANNWISAISATGVITKSQPASSNLSDGANLAKINAGNSWSVAQVPNANTVNLGQDGTTWNDIYLKNSGTSTHRITATTPTADRTHTLPNADSTTVVASSGSAGQFATGISSAGVISYGTPSGFAQFGGDGSAGAVSITSNSAASQAKMQRNCTTYSLTGANIGDTIYSGSIINATGTVSLACTGTTGGIICQTGPDGGSAGTTSSNAGNGSGIYGGGGAAIDISAGGAGGSSAFATGGAGGAGAGGTGGTFPQTTMSGARLIEGGGGGGGGSANTSSIAGPGGDGGGVFVIAAAGAITLSPASAGRVEMLAGSAGVAGSGSGTGAGGGAGGGGGVGFHYSLTSITQGSNATVNYSGGAGGNGGANNAGGGGGGAGGGPVYVSPSNSIAGTVTVSGGSGGTKVGTGVNGTAGGNGPSGGVSITATPNLPLISLHLDFRGIRRQLQIADGMRFIKGINRTSPIEIDGKDHISFMAAIYAAPGCDRDLRFCLNSNADYDPRAFCDASVFGADLDKAHPMMRKFLSGNPMPEAKPVCIKEAMLDNAA